MASPTDIQKLTEQMQRAKTLTAKAADSGRNSEAIMNNFEQTLVRYDEHMEKVKEYHKQLESMMAITDNGGPPLDSTFPPPVEVVHTVPQVDVTASSSIEVRGVSVSEVPQG